MIDVGIGVSEQPAALIGIGGKILLHFFVDFFLQVDAEGAIGADHLVGADTGAGGDITVWIGNSDVSRIVANDELCALRGCVGESFEEDLVEVGVALLVRGGESRVGDGREHKSEGNAEDEAAHR